MIGEPPLLIGAVHDTTAQAFPGVAVTAVGESGALNEDGVTAAQATDAGEAPATFVAVTVNVYGVPLVNPVTVPVIAPAVDTVAPPGDAVTV